jgi:hypothetical protein
MSSFSLKQNQPQQRTSSDTASRKALAHSTSHHEHPILNLQRTIGNQAVLRLMRAGSQAGEVASTRGAAGVLGSGFARIPVSSTPARAIQTKLTVNTPGDAYEQEADRVADQVMRMPAPQAAAAHATSAASVGSASGIQRACACGGTCDDCKKKHPEDDHAHVQMKAAGPASTGAIEAPPIVHDVLRSPGQPLDAATRAFMEPRFGYDFSRVRIHADEKAAESARSVNARAYTVGRDVVFDTGRYVPAASSGRRLMAHELTHVIQQTAGSSNVRDGSGVALHGPSSAAQMPVGSGTVQCDKKPASSATLSIKFTDKKSPDDKLTFPKKRACSEELGLFDCSANRMWVWSVEIEGDVKDDASQWDVSQSFTGQKKGVVKTTSGSSVKFDKALNEPDDNPLSDFVQQNSGAKKIFWIDSPGHQYDLDANKFDSVTQVQNFVSKICSKTSAKTCTELKWSVKIVVNPGQKLDTKASAAGLGHKSTKL